MHCENGVIVITQQFVTTSTAKHIKITVWKEKLVPVYL